MVSAVQPGSKHAVSARAAHQPRRRHALQAELLASLGSPHGAPQPSQAQLSKAAKKAAKKAKRKEAAVTTPAAQPAPICSAGGSKTETPAPAAAAANGQPSTADASNAVPPQQEPQHQHQQQPQHQQKQEHQQEQEQDPQHQQQQQQQQSKHAKDSAQASTTQQPGRPPPLSYKCAVTCAPPDDSGADSSQTAEPSAPAEAAPAPTAPPAAPPAESAAAGGVGAEQPCAQLEEEEQLEWQTVQAGRKARKQRSPAPQLSPAPGRPQGGRRAQSPAAPPRARTPSCVSLNSTCSTASRDIEIISGCAPHSGGIPSYWQLP